MKRCIYPIILIFLTYGQISYQGKAVLNSDLTGKRIKLSLDNGYIHVQGWEKKSIEIYAYQESRLLDDKPLNFILIESAQTIQLHPEDQSGFYTYEIFAPYAINLDLTIHNTGFIRVNKIAGEIEANSSSGNIRLSETSGSAIVNSQTGTIFADFVSLNNKQHYAFSNAYGSVYLSIPDDSRVTFEISTVKGDAYSDFKLSVPQDNNKTETVESEYLPLLRGRILGRLNGGGVKVPIHTLSGDIYIEKIINHKGAPHALN